MGVKTEPPVNTWLRMSSRVLPKTLIRTNPESWRKMLTAIEDVLPAHLGGHPLQSFNQCEEIGWFLPGRDDLPQAPCCGPAYLQL